MGWEEFGGLVAGSQVGQEENELGREVLKKG